jgi:protein CpxP
MKSNIKNKILLGVFFLLLFANIATLIFFWADRPKRKSRQAGPPVEFLISQLEFDQKQQQDFQPLVQKHRQQVREIRDKIALAKAEMFDLLKKPDSPDSLKHVAARKVSLQLEELDLVTLDHFGQIRKLCNTSQKEKFDEILHQLAAIISSPRPPLGGSEMDSKGPPKKN